MERDSNSSKDAPTTLAHLATVRNSRFGCLPCSFAQMVSTEMPKRAASSDAQLSVKPAPAEESDLAPMDAASRQGSCSVSPAASAGGAAEPCFPFSRRRRNS